MMSRSIRIRGPAGPFDVPDLLSPFATIPGFTVTRSFDDGDLVILLSIYTSNGAAGGDRLTIAVRIDGTRIPIGAPDHFVPGSQVNIITLNYAQPLAAGTHTIDVQVQGGLGTALNIPNGRTELIILQTGPLSPADDFITL